MTTKNIHVTCPWIVKNIESHGSFKGYASVFHELDDHGDRVLPGAFVATIAKWHTSQKMPKMLWQHNQAEPVGWWKTICEDQHGLYVEGQLLLSIQKAQEIYEMMKSNMIDGLSIGCRIMDAEFSEISDERLLKSLDLFEISLVTFAANSKARIKTIKSTSSIVKVKSDGSMRASERLLHSLQRTQQILQARS